MDKWIGKVATGAYFGISEETCKQLVKSGMIVVGFSRKEHSLQSLSSGLIDMELSSGTSKTEVLKLKAIEIADAIVNILSFPRNSSIKV